MRVQCLHVFHANRGPWDGVNEAREAVLNHEQHHRRHFRTCHPELSSNYQTSQDRRRLWRQVIKSGGNLNEVCRAKEITR